VTGKDSNITLTFEQRDGRTMCMFHLYNLLWGAEWQCSFSIINDVPRTEKKEGRKQVVGEGITTLHQKYTFIVS